MKAAKHDGRQTEFGFAPEVTVLRSTVETLCRYCKETIRETVSGWAWGMDAAAKAPAMSGRLHAVTYEAWLRFYSPLSHS